MEIDKILFGQLSQSKGINNPFEDLDVNNDGKINEEDANCATSNDIKSVINNLLNTEDEEENIQIIDDFKEEKTFSSATKSSGYDSGINQNITWTVDNFFDSIDLSVTTWYQSGLKSDTNFKNIKNQMLSDPQLSQKLSNSDIAKIRSMISDSTYKVYSSDLQAILDAVESKQNSVETIKNNLVDSELPEGKSVTVDVNYQYNDDNDSVTIQNVNGTYVYSFEGNNNSNFSLTDSQLDKIMTVINSDENFKNIFQSMLQTNVSDPGGNWNNNLTGMQATFINTKKSGSLFSSQSFMDAIATALGTTANVAYDGNGNHGKYEFTNELGLSSSVAFCTSCKTAPQIFLADIFKALQAREMLNVAKNGDNTATNADNSTSQTSIISKTSAEKVSSSNANNIELASLKTEKEALQEEYDSTTTQYEEAQKLLDTYTKEYENYQKEIEEVNSQILAEQERQEVKQEEQMDSLVNKAINSYNKDEDGDFEAYLQKTMDNNGYPIYSNLDSLSSNSTLLSDKAKYVLNNITLQSSIVAGLKTSLDTIASQLTSVNDKINNIASTTTVAEVQGVTEVSEVTNVDEVSQTDTTQTTTTTKAELKTMDEYMEMMDEKYADLFNQLDSMEWRDAVKMLTSGSGGFGSFISKASEYFDADSDGRVTVIDMMLWQNYLNNYNNQFSDVVQNKSTQAGTTGMGRGLSNICGQLYSDVLANKYGTSYDLDDLEQINYLLETSDYSADELRVTFHVPHVKFNITEIAQDENWEEKLDNSVINGKHISSSYYKQLKQAISDAREYMTKNPDNSQYASVAAGFNLYKSNCERTQRLIDDGRYFISDTPKYYEKNGMTYEEGLNQKNGNILKSQYADILLYVGDANGDGTVNFKDINDLPDEIDLDGDGTISKEEKEYLKHLKLFMYENAGQYRKTTNINDDVDNCIEYLNYKESEPVVTELEKDFKETFTWLYSSSGYNVEECTNADGLIRTTGWFQDVDENGEKALPPIGGGQWYMRTETYGKYGVIATTGVTTGSDFVYRLKNRINNSDLSKSELEEILLKINNASSSAQSQLTEVKAVVEEKLKAFS